MELLSWGIVADNLAKTYHDTGPRKHLPQTSRGVVRQRALEVVLRVETGVVVDTISHVVVGLVRGLDSGVVGEVIKAGHVDLCRKEVRRLVEKACRECLEMREE